MYKEQKGIESLGSKCRQEEKKKLWNRKLTEKENKWKAK